MPDEAPSTSSSASPWSMLRGASYKVPGSDAAHASSGIATTTATVEQQAGAAADAAAAALSPTVAAPKGSSPEWRSPTRAVTETSLAINPEPMTLSFKDLNYYVPAVGGGWNTILRSVTGQCRAARLTACMGPSGAGKSTLLKILACNIAGGVREGDLEVNGKAIDPADFRRKSSVVWQSDVLLPCATVAEALMTSALLKLPQKMPRRDKQRRVEQILTELELQAVKHSRIGQDIDGASSGISGGERRRVSVGIGLVNDAAVLFLDEPTTGLDSDSAATLVHLLSHLAVAKKRTVVCTIHQPSSDICEMFDDLLLLAAGRVLYCGRWRGVDSYLAGCGMPRPTHRSTAEHILTVSKDIEAVVALAERSDGGVTATTTGGAVMSAASRAGSLASGAGVVSRSGGSIRQHGNGAGVTANLTLHGPGSMKLGGTPSRQQSLASAALAAERAANNNCSLRDINGATSGDDPSGGGSLPPMAATSRVYQVLVLSQRFLRSWARTPALLGVQLAQYLFFGVLLGATYWRLCGADATNANASAGVFDRVASLWFVVLCCILQPSANACTIMYSQKALLRREAGGGLYKVSAFFVAKSITSFPFQLLFASVFNTIIYFAIGYQASLTKFATFFGINLTAMLVSESLGTLAAALHRSELIGQIVLSLLFVPLLMYTGFIQTRTPAYLAWLKKVSFAGYAYSALVSNEFEGLKLPPVRGAPAAPADALVPKNIRNGLSIGADVAVLFAFLVALRVGAYLLFARAIKNRKL